MPIRVNSATEPSTINIIDCFKSGQFPHLDKLLDMIYSVSSEPIRIPEITQCPVFGI